MFWNKNKSKKNTSNKNQKPSRDEIIAQATGALQAKREEIGDETLTAIREAIEKKKNDPLMRAKKQIEATDLDKVLDHLTMTMREDKDR